MNISRKLVLMQCKQISPFKYLLIFLISFGSLNSVLAKNVSQEDNVMSQEKQLDHFFNAVNYRYIDSLEKILVAGFDPNVIVNNPMASSGESALLVKLIDSRYPNNSDLTDETKVIELLLKFGSDITVANDKDLGLLHLAAKNSRLELVDILLSYGINKNAVDTYGQTAAFHAEDVATLTFFLDRGIGSLEDREKWGLTLLHESVNGIYSKLDLVQYLSGRVDVNSKDNKGNTPIWTLIKNKNLALDIEEQAIALIEQGADIKSFGTAGNSLLIKSIRKELNAGFIQYLLTIHNNVNQADNNGYVAAHHATEFSQGVEYLKVLGSFGADLNVASMEEGQTALMFSIIDNNAPAIDYLLSQAVTLNISDKLGKTALNYALEKENITLIKLLKVSGAKSSDEVTIASATTAYKIEQQRPKNLEDAIKAQDINLVEQFYKEEKSALTLDVTKAAFIAARYGFTDALSFFVTQGFDLKTKREKDSLILLHTSVAYNQVSTSEFLIEQGLDVSAISLKGSSIFLMVANSSPEMLALLEKHGTKYNPKYDSKIVSRAISKDNFVMAEIFTKRGYPFDKDHYFSSDFVVLNVIRREDQELLSFLLSQGYDINSRFHEFFVECNLLYAAINFQANSMIQPLLDAGIDVEAYAGSESMLAAAIKSGSLETLQKIIKHKPTLKLDQIDISHNMNSTNALAYALYHQRESVAKYLLDFKIDINKVDDSGKTALHYAAQYGFVDIIEDLIAKGAKINRSSLKHAIEYKQEDSVLILLANGSFDNGDMNQQEGDGTTLLHYAAKEGFEKVVGILIEHKADVNILNNEMLTAADTAALNNHQVLADKLEGMEDNTVREYEELMDFAIIE
jgi:ankyrin repeat protein